MERVSRSRPYETAGRANDGLPTNLLFWSSLFEGLGRSGNFLQLQIRQMIVTAIEDGRLPLGVRMPSSRDLSGILRVSRNTIVIAYEHLVDQNFLVSRERSGYFVAGLPKRIGSSQDNGAPTTDCEESSWTR